MAEEEIVIRIVADDSELIASLNNIAGEAEGLEGVMNDVSENISEGFDIGGVEEYGDAWAVLKNKRKNYAQPPKKVPVLWVNLPEARGVGFLCWGVWAGPLVPPLAGLAVWAP